MAGQVDGSHHQIRPRCIGRLLDVTGQGHVYYKPLGKRVAKFGVEGKDRSTNLTKLEELHFNQLGKVRTKPQP